MKKTLALMIVMACVSAGCQSPFQESRKAAYGRWYGARAQMLCNVAENALNNGDIDTAASKAREAKTLTAELPEARVLLGRVYIEQGSYAAAVEELSEAVELREEDPKTWYLLGVAQEKNAQPLESIESYSKAIELDNYYKDAIIAKAQVLVETGNTTRAKRVMDDNFHVYQNDHKCIDLFGRIAMLDGDYPKAVEIFRRSLEVESDNNETRLMLARSLMSSGRFDHARDEIVKLIDDDKFQADAWVYSMLGDCYLGISVVELAYEAYTKASQLAPENPGSWAKLAQADLAAGRLDRASRNADRALERHKDHLPATLVSAMVLIKTGKPSVALAKLYPLARKYPENPTVLCLMGRCHEISGEEDQAQKYYQRAAQLAPENAIAQLLSEQH